MIASVNSIELDILRGSYSPRETLQAEITGNFISLNSDNLFIYKEGIPRATPVISDLTKYGDKYYYYAHGSARY